MQVLVGEIDGPTFWIDADLVLGVLVAVFMVAL
jgi:hypothetical protein